MKRKTLFIAVPLLLIFVLVFFLFYGLESPPAVLKDIPIFPRVDTEKSRLRLHALTTEQAREAYMEQPVSTWEEWADRLTERGLGILVELNPDLDTPEKIAKKRTEIREGWEIFVERGKSLQDKPPQPGEDFSFGKLGEFLPMGVMPSRRHEGPQTTEALMASFDDNYVRITPETSRWDAHYPREEWIQVLLNKGVRFENRSDYDLYLDMRGYVIMAESHPELWDSGLSGVARVNNFEDYKDAYIDRRVFQQETFKDIRQSDPDMVSVMWPSERPDKYLVMKGDRLYVRMNHETLSADTWGKLVSKEEMRDLIVNGTLPENREVIFINEDYDVISEADVHYEKQQYIEQNGTSVSPDGVDTFDEFSSIDGFDFAEEEFFGDTEDFDSMDFQVDPREVAREKFLREKFQNDLRRLAEFTDMPESEIAAEFERQILQQFVSDDLPADGSMSRVLDILDKHGFAEGLRRIKRDDPTIADMLGNFLGEPKAPQDPPQNIPPPPNDSQ